MGGGGGGKSSAAEGVRTDRVSPFMLRHLRTVMHRRNGHIIHYNDYAIVRCTRA